MMSCGAAEPSTPIEFVSRLTEQDVTPGTLLTAFSTRAEQAAQLAEQFVSADGTGRIAVICPDNLIAPVRDAVRRKLAVILDPAEYARLIEQPEWDEQISVCGTETVKGLEFDAVVVVEPGLIEDDAPSRLVAASDLYVAMTRPTQKLVIVRTKADEKSLNI